MASISIGWFPSNLNEWEIVVSVEWTKSLHWKWMEITKHPQKHGTLFVVPGSKIWISCSCFFVLLSFPTTTEQLKTMLRRAATGRTIILESDKRPGEKPELASNATCWSFAVGSFDVQPNFSFSMIDCRDGCLGAFLWLWTYSSLSYTCCILYKIYIYT